MIQQYHIRYTEEMGRGLYANNDIQSGTMLFIAELLVLSPEDTVKVNDTDLKWYTFKYNDRQDCLVLGDGEIFNHSDTPNVKYVLVDYQNRKAMAFFTTTKVNAGEQLFIDYSADIKVDSTKYNVNLV